LGSLLLYQILVKNKKLSVDNFFKNPWKILALAEPRQSRGEATSSEINERLEWRCVLDKIRTYFKENPDVEF